jgi:hypothetical protein
MPGADAYEKLLGGVRARIDEHADVRGRRFAERQDREYEHGEGKREHRS